MTMPQRGMKFAAKTLRNLDTNLSTAMMIYNFTKERNFLTNVHPSEQFGLSRIFNQKLVMFFLAGGIISTTFYSFSTKSSSKEKINAPPFGFKRDTPANTIPKSDFTPANLNGCEID